MKLVRSTMLVSLLAAGVMLSGCSTMSKTMGSAAMTETMNAVSDLSMPVKINNTFTVTKLTKGTNSVTLNIDLAKTATGSIDQYIARDLQGQLASSALCYLPELKAGNTKVIANIYQNGKFKKSITKSPSYLCGK